MSANHFEAVWESNFRRHMKQARESHGISQSEMARKLKSRGLPFHQQTVQRLESGERPVRLDEAFLIAAELGLTIETMTGGEPAGLTEARYVIERLMQRSDGVAGAISESLGDWELEFDLLAFTFEEFRKTHDLNDSRAMGQISWLAAWVQKGVWAYDSVWEALVRLKGLSREYSEYEDLDRISNAYASAMALELDESADFWQKFDESDLPSFKADQSPIELMAQMPVVADGEDKTFSSALQSESYRRLWTDVRDVDRAARELRSAVGHFIGQHLALIATVTDVGAEGASDELSSKDAAEQFADLLNRAKSFIDTTPRSILDQAERDHYGEYDGVDQETS